MTRSDPAPFLTIQGLSKTYGSFTALDRIDLTIPRGAFVCFLGPSGCGKTTLLRIVAGLDRQDAGRIAMGGVDVSKAPPAERDFGIVFQSYALFPNLTVADNVAYGLVNRRMTRDRIKARVAELLALVGLPDQAAKYPVQLSGGQQQRIALARALATSPSLLLLDEPLSALDAKVRLRLREEIRALQKRLGLTTIMVTHDQEEALAMADSVVVMNHGRIEQVGTPEAIYRNPATAFVADFIGAMTFLDGTVSPSQALRVGSVDLVCEGGRGFLPGSPVRLGFRPEEIRIGGVSAGDVNAVEVRVKSLEFLGSFYRARLEPRRDLGGSLVADVSANLFGDLRLAEGQSLYVALPPGALRAFPQAPAA
ncbi:putative 2-aminoethylphosphonate ABC transporter ATP-binding protein [Methylobacterium oryzihabitans]|uniref:Putative 2-aminoethylphosphonate ABC transporter ATP-binding protein n=1 Tax=Methylobacterium oryzihabitans TaxID=2499852 RepID=A0A437NY98_9HYPH|nr:putative 2-aminoethylphosphonate ABC transporter ATP-binding protein [Methylobacterium oryzihabitans]RVU14957.1 putative 2-aminoethylphosphonate ABC transporter ATP-binding protein [Methylobacterium oryzihabitans]